MTTERVINFTKDWPRQLTKPLIAKLCASCTMLTCSDTAAGCKLRQELRKRDRAWYQRNKKKVCKRLRQAYRADPVKFLNRIADYRKRNTEKAREANRRWREENRERYNARHREYKRKRRLEVLAARAQQ